MKQFLISACNVTFRDCVTLLKTKCKTSERETFPFLFLLFTHSIPEFLTKDRFIVCLLCDIKRGRCTQNGTAGLDIHIPRFSHPCVAQHFYAVFANFLQQSLTAGQVINTDAVKTFRYNTLLFIYTFSGSLLFRKDCILSKKSTFGITPI
jgi:hypothetical protein